MKKKQKKSKSRLSQMALLRKMLHEQIREKLDLADELHASKGRIRAVMRNMGGQLNDAHVKYHELAKKFVVATELNEKLDDKLRACAVTIERLAGDKRRLEEALVQISEITGAWIEP